MKDVTVSNFVRAETDHMFRTNMKMGRAKIGAVVHVRAPTTPDNQPVIRMNQDTLYSGTLLDLSSPVKLTLPEVGGRYMSMHVTNQDHYMFVEAKPGTYVLTEEKVGTRFAYVIIRTFADINDPDDLDKAHAAQDAIELAVSTWYCVYTARKSKSWPVNGGIHRFKHHKCFAVCCFRKNGLTVPQNLHECWN